VHPVHELYNRSERTRSDTDAVISSASTVVRRGADDCCENGDEGLEAADSEYADNYADHSMTRCVEHRVRNTDDLRC